MQAVRSKDTKPEIIVRRFLHAMGYRYRLHRKDLPGRPDIAFIGRRKAIFVHGCYWGGIQDNPQTYPGDTTHLRFRCHVLVHDESAVVYLRSSF